MTQAELEPEFLLAMQAYLSGRLAEAEQHFNQITLRWPHCIEAWFQRADIAEQQQNFEAAISHYEKVLAHNPEVQEVWFRLGSIAAHQNMPELAINYWNQALKINPQYAEPHLHLGLLYARSEHPLAQQHLEQASQLSESPLPLIALARTLLWQNQHRTAAQVIAAILNALTQAETLSPVYPHALAIAVQIAHEQQDDERALSLLSESQLFPEQQLTLKNLYLSLKAPAEAIADFLDKLKQLPPPSLPPEAIPNLLAWDKHHVQQQVRHYLFADKPRASSVLHTAPTAPFRLICLIHESAIPLWPTYLAYLKTLPRQYWDLQLLVLHQHPLPIDTLKATVHQLKPEKAHGWLEQHSFNLLLHTGVDRQADALALAQACRSFRIPSLKWTPYSVDAFDYKALEDPCFSGELSCQSLHDSPPDPLHLHRWSVSLQHHLRQSFSTF